MTVSDSDKTHRPGTGGNAHPYVVMDDHGVRLAEYRPYSGILLEKDSRMPVLDELALRLLPAEKRKAVRRKFNEVQSLKIPLENKSGGYEIVTIHDLKERQQKETDTALAGVESQLKDIEAQVSAAAEKEDADPEEKRVLVTQARNSFLREIKAPIIEKYKKLFTGIRQIADDKFEDLWNDPDCHAIFLPTPDEGLVAERLVSGKPHSLVMRPDELRQIGLGHRLGALQNGESIRCDTLARRIFYDTTGRYNILDYFFQSEGTSRLFAIDRANRRLKTTAPFDAQFINGTPEHLLRKILAHPMTSCLYMNLIPTIPPEANISNDNKIYLHLVELARGGHDEAASFLWKRMGGKRRQRMGATNGGMLHATAVESEMPEFKMLTRHYEKPDARPVMPLTEPVIIQAASTEKLKEDEVLKLSLFLEGYFHPEELTHRMVTLFGSGKAATDFVRKALSDTSMGFDTHTAQPVHDICDINLPPEDATYNKEAWVQLVKRYGHAVYKYLPAAGGIERVLDRYNEKAITAPRELSKLSLQELDRFASEITYTYSYLDRELASACRPLHIPEEYFNTGREARRNIATEDHIPSIGLVDGAELRKQKPTLPAEMDSYYMMRLERHDPRIMLTGCYVGCCDRLGGFLHKAAVAHVESPDSGVYALFRKTDGQINPKQDAIAAKVGVWRGKWSGSEEKPVSTMVFNAWERQQSLASFKAEPFLVEAARRAMNEDKTIPAVHIGAIRDGKWFDSTAAVSSENPACQSQDSIKQHHILNRGELQEANIDRETDFSKKIKSWPAPKQTSSGLAAA